MGICSSQGTLQAKYGSDTPQSCIADSKREKYFMAKLIIGDEYLKVGLEHQADECNDTVSYQKKKEAESFFILLSKIRLG